MLFDNMGKHMEGIRLHKISQTEKDTYHLVSLICYVKKESKSSTQRSRGWKVVARVSGVGGLGEICRGW